MANPTHHQLVRNFNFWSMDMEEGSMPGWGEKSRAMSFGLPEEEERVIVVFISPGLVIAGNKASVVLKE